MKKLTIAAALCFSVALPVLAQTPAELFVTLNTGSPMTQGMALVLASQAVEQKVAPSLAAMQNLAPGTGE